MYIYTEKGGVYVFGLFDFASFVVYWLLVALHIYVLRQMMELLYEWPTKYTAGEEADGKVWIAGVYHFACTVHECYDLHAFPFDLQEIPHPKGFVTYLFVLVCIQYIYTHACTYAYMPWFRFIFICMYI